MQNLIQFFNKQTLSIHRYVKRIIVISIDLFLCLFCTWIAFILRLEELIPLKEFNFYLGIISIFIAIPMKEIDINNFLK